MQRDMDLTSRERQRYSRHLLLPEVGEEGQRRLKSARVLCVGAGGLGSPAALYLAAAGIGTLGLVDFDVVDFSNLQRQIIHGTADVGRSKLDSARDRIAAINPEVDVETFEARFSAANLTARQLQGVLICPTLTSTGRTNTPGVCCDAQPPRCTAHPDPRRT